MEKMFLDYENDSMAFLRDNDLRELLLYVESRFLEYRDSLGLPADVSIGLELEYENFNRKETDAFVRANLKGWESDYEGTVTRGGEVRSPILYDNVKSWESLKLICNYLRENGATTMRRAGGHIHVGSHVLGSDTQAWFDFFKLYVAYEHVLYRFFYGDLINPRITMEEYAPPIADSMRKRLSNMMRENNFKLEPFLNSYNDKEYAINFNNVDRENINKVKKKNTIEFRLPNATVFEVVEQNNVNVCTKMLVTAQKKVMDMDFLDYKIEHYRSYGGSEYRDICLKDALEFVDLVFDKNIDKIYFLRQYLKDFADNFGLVEPTKAKIFYKIS